MSKPIYESQQSKEFAGAVWRCLCGENSYLVLGEFDDGDIYLTITQNPTRLKDRLSSAWRALRGLEFTSSNELLLDPDQSLALIQEVERLRPTVLGERGKQIRENLKFGGGATHYCKYCNTWGTPMPGDWNKEPCGNCGQIGFQMLNPFPGNMIPYIELSPDLGEGKEKCRQF